LPKLTVLDVGHGNSAVLHDEQGTLVIDGGKQQILLQYLRANNVTEVDAVLISHADHDHIGGIIDLLLAREIHIHALYLNLDAAKRTRVWQELRYAAAERWRNGEMKILLQLTTDAPGVMDRGNVQIEILSPTPLTALAGPGEQDIDGTRVTTNSMSAVIRICSDKIGQVLLAGDMERPSLDDIMTRGVPIQANLLIYPHHGGLPRNADAFAFAQRLCSIVSPELVIFSIGRGFFDTPRPEIVAGIKSAVPNTHIACTQLSERCAANLPSSSPAHLCTSHAHGYTNNGYCAGTIEIYLDSPISLLPTVQDHLAFIRTHAPTALCQNRVILNDLSSETAD
jgi:beta-lactamase superfamily II metal-dependent hydrolase